MNAILHVRPGRCSRCGSGGTRYLLRLRPGLPPGLELAPANVHNGLCLGCWREVADAIIAAADFVARPA